MKLGGVAEGLLSGQGQGVGVGGGAGGSNGDVTGVVGQRDFKKSFSNCSSVSTRIGRHRKGSTQGAGAWQGLWSVVPWLQ